MRSIGPDPVMPKGGAVRAWLATCGRRNLSRLGRAHLRPALHGAEEGSVALRPAHPTRESHMPQIVTSGGAIRGHTAESGAIYRALRLPATAGRVVGRAR